MKLYLASYAKDTIDKILAHASIAPRKAIFIPTAGDPYENKDFVEADRLALENRNISTEVLDIKNLKQPELEQKISNADLVLVAGGDTFYLMGWLKKSGADKVIKNFVENGGFYIGSSAGSIVCCDTIAGAEKFDDPKNGFDLQNYDGLKLFPNVIIPHAQKEKYYERIISATRKLAEKGLIVFPIADADVVFYDGKNTTVL